jgi:hypothetical protein
MLKTKNGQTVVKSSFIKRFALSITFGLLIIGFALGMGMLGYHHYENMTWVDAFVNASMILSGMGPVSPLATDGGKIFAGSYALFSGLAFIVVMGIIFAPILHHFFRKIHLDLLDDERKSNR